jgi:hypothetical protein
MKFIKKPPDGKTRNNIECTMGKVGEPTDPVNQSEPDGHQGEGKTIDDSVNQDVHKRILKYWNNGVLEWWENQNKKNPSFH